MIVDIGRWVLQEAVAQLAQWLATGVGDGLTISVNVSARQLRDPGIVEAALADLPAGETVQFERLGYFCPDSDSSPGLLVFNRTLGLKDSWARMKLGS